MPVRPRCSQQTATGKPCKNLAVHGFDRCSAHLGRVGRKTHLTPEVADHLVTMLRAGTYLPVALRASGVGKQTYHDWMRRGRVGKADDVIYIEFAERVEQAQAEAEVRLVAEIARAARDSWQAAAWLLERVAPTRYGKPSVRMRDTAPPEEKVAPPVADDPFSEVDELAEKRRGRIVG